MAEDPPKRPAPEPGRPVMEWLLDSDASIRWQAMRDLLGAPAEQDAAERERVATEGQPSRWNTLRATRVPDWYSARD